MTLDAQQTAQELAERGLHWLAQQPVDDDLSLYSGLAGVVLALLEGHGDSGFEAYADAALEGARALASSVEGTESSSLYFGNTGTAFCLRAVHQVLGDDDAGRAADRALMLVRERFDGERWNEMTELLVGNAGIALGALAAGDEELALTAVTPYLRLADPTPGGVNWKVRPSEARSHHVAHGTLGIVLALATVGAATGRADLVELALAGAADVVGRDEAGPDGFLVPHSDPPHRPELIERYSYGWCNGPAGDAQVFRRLAAVTGDPRWDELQDRCWNTVVESGLPARLRPGFWDNNGRCCGTAGVLALACDRYAEGRGTLGFAGVLVDDLATRATVDGAGARWSNDEHRATPSRLPPRNGWAMGNAGIVRELLRFHRLAGGGDPGYAVCLPDQPALAGTDPYHPEPGREQNAVK
ncbi:lanthionine synthetase LanC family protein [Angustibacter luteus]|uniref:Lanthionine synthetase LanC family protein n=1 Tax=Angustibacter luteus TaxID=658456 RepID=A0ABW1JC21_9ACTN